MGISSQLLLCHGGRGRDEGYRREGRVEVGLVQGGNGEEGRVDVNRKISFNIIFFLLNLFVYQESSPFIRSFFSASLHHTGVRTLCVLYNILLYSLYAGYHHR